MPANDMDGALKRVLESSAGRMSGCDPEQNAAYVEGRLRPAERRSLEAHLADCTDCRRLVTDWLAETMPEPAAVPHPARTGWRWALPALAGVAAVGSVVLYYRPHRPVLVRPEVKLEAPAPSPPPASAANAAVKAKPAGRAAEPALADKPARPLPAVDALREERSLTAPAALPPVTQAAPLPPAAPQLPPVSQSAQSSRFVQEAPQLERQNAAREVAAAPAAEGAAGALAADERRDAGLKKARAAGALSYRRQAEASAAPLPDGAAVRSQVRRGLQVWAVSEAGRLYRSGNGGATWQPVSTPAQSPLVRVEWDGDTPAVIVTDKDNRTYRIQP